VNIIKSNDFKSADAYYYSNSFVEVGGNEKEVAAPRNLCLSTAETKQKEFTVARLGYFLLTLSGDSNRIHLFVCFSVSLV